MRIVLAFVLLFAAACSSDAETTEVAALSTIIGGPVMSTDGPLLVTPSPDVNTAFDAAEVGGTVNIENNCVTLDEALPIWPAGTTWDNGEIVLPDGTRLVDGDAITAGGGWVSVTDLDMDSQYWSLGRKLVEGCSARSIVTLNPDSVIKR